MKTIAPCFLFMMILAACQSRTAKTAAPVTKIDTTGYFPVAAFFKDQKEYVDLRDFHIRYFHSLDTKKDSGEISKDVFLSWAGRFAVQAQLFEHDRQEFKESVFQDLSTNSYTLNYTRVTAKTAGIQYMDVLLDEQTHSAKRVFIKTLRNSGDTAITEQYNWNALKGFQYTQSKTTGPAFTSAEVTNVNWTDKK